MKDGPWSLLDSRSSKIKCDIGSNRNPVSKYKDNEEDGGEERGMGLDGAWATSFASATWERELKVSRRLAMSLPNPETLMEWNIQC